MRRHCLIPQFVIFSACVWAIGTWWLYLSSDYRSYESFHDVKAKSTAISPETPNTLGFDTEGLYWFIQLSDLHISEYGDGRGAENLEQFLNKEQKFIKPRFIVVTGDITDAKGNSGLTCKQRVMEWTKYKAILKKYDVWNKTDYWFDLRGNHDCFNVGSWNSSDNYFAKYSVQKQTSYYKTITNELGTLSVIAIDGCPSYGPSRPYNFFGTLDRCKMDQLERHIEFAKSANSSHVILIGHYPTVTLQSQRTSSGKSFSELTEEITLYLSGHLHQLFLGLGRKIVAFQSTGFLDLEISDLKDHDTFRIVAIDKNQVSFSDHKLTIGPYVHLLNPKPADQLLPKHDPKDLMRKSSHVRILVFDSRIVTRVNINFDQEQAVIWGKLAKDSSNLWVFPWKVHKYDDYALHYLHIEVEIEDESLYTFTHAFKVEGPPSSLGTIGESLLHLNLRKWVQSTFWALYLSTIVIMAVFLIFAHKEGQDCRLQLRLEAMIFGHHRSRLSWCKIKGISLILTVVQLAQNISLSIPLWLYALSISLAPSFAGNLASSSPRMAWVFLFGIYHDSNWIVILDTWFYALIHMIFFVIPSLLLIVLYQSDKTMPARRNDDAENAGISTPLHRRPWFSLLVFLWWLFNLGRLGRIKSNYGIESILFSPFYTWYFVFVTVVLWRAQAPTANSLDSNTD